VYYPATKRLTEGMTPNMKNTSYSIAADIQVPVGGANGMIINQGGYFGGTALMLLQGKPSFAYTLL
jgi:hypothetical protein